MNEGNRYKKSPIIQITRESTDQSEPVATTTMTTTYDQTTSKMSSTANVNDTSQKNRETAKADTRNLELIAGNVQQGKGADTTIGGGSAAREEQTHAYKKRFFVLALFCSHSAINSFQWIQYSSITNVIANYYGASNLQVNLTSLVYMITYIPFIIQASLMLERVGLRKAVLIGTIGTALGSLVKWWMGGEPGMTAFWWMMAGQTIVALSQLYIISIPPLLAAVWFPDHQVSTATGIGVFGNQLGIALGFIVPPWIIKDANAAKELIGHDLNTLSCAIFWISFAICAVTLITLEDKPPKPPGSASLHAANQQHQDSLEQTTKIDSYASIKELCRDRDFGYLILSYGINVGCFYAVSTVLNQMVAARWPELVDLAGMMGLLIVVSGMAGSVMCGQLLDRTHAYKTIIVLIYLFSLVSMLLFTLVLRLFKQVWPLYLASITLGFFMTGYLPLGFEFAAEITYPHPANTPAGLLNLFAQVSSGIVLRTYNRAEKLTINRFPRQIFGLALTYASSLMVDEYGDLWANAFLTTCLAVGLVLTIFIKADLKRQKAVAEEQMRF